MISTVIELIGSFLGGIIISPIIVEIYRLYVKDMIDNKEKEHRRAINERHSQHMETLYKKFDRETANYNAKLEKLKRKLARRNLFIQRDKDGNEILVEYRRIRQSRNRG